MEEEDFQDRIFDFFRHNFIVVLLLIGGLVFIGVGISQMMGQKSATVEFEKGEVVQGVSIETKSSDIKVDVEGEVVSSGVYTLKSDSRVQDAIDAAGGLSASAERSALNLAQKISDGQKIYVPAIGEKVTEVSSVVSGGGPSTDTGSVGSLINVNSASQSDLESLPGVGPVTAGKIISNRPYGSLDELVIKKALNNGTFDKIRAQISI